MKFWLGTHETAHMERTAVPLFVSHRRLKRRKALPRAIGPWSLDSGGFTEVTQFGGWQTTEAEYVEAIMRYQDEIGGLEWAAPMDWMCEDIALKATGLTVEDHQHRTVENYCRLAATGLPIIPVLQGFQPADYWRCVDIYTDAGVDLVAAPLVGLGTVCRRQNTGEVDLLVGDLANAGLSLHGFGVKLTGLASFGWALTSADSLAWSYNARKNPPMSGCTHKSCANCLRWALAWREKALRASAYQQPRLAV